MKVYKFGGASVKDAAGIRNMAQIVQQAQEPLFVVISAMGKTTNALEAVYAAYRAQQAEVVADRLQAIFDYHLQVASELFGAELPVVHNDLLPLFDALRSTTKQPLTADPDQQYDAIVSYGELLSTRLISRYLQYTGMACAWVDMRYLLRTDNTFREANIDFATSARHFATIDFTRCPVYIGQGFIGGYTKDGILQPTTLGREGSDYTAAVVANLLDAKSVTIWKDVPGILNADPKRFAQATLIPYLTYYDAVELSYSGAQIIHPKTIRPLENKQIPLYVKPFAEPTAAGSVIQATIPQPIDIPIYIVRDRQVLITIRPNDFSFALEDALSHVFAILHKHKQKVTLIQSSAVTISVAVDASHHLLAAIEALSADYRVTYNEGLQLLTIRNTTDALTAQATVGREVLLRQITRRTAKCLLTQTDEKH